MTAHEEQRRAALHEYRLLDAPAGDELEAVVRVAGEVRFCASAPLVTPPGHALGSLGVFADPMPHLITSVLGYARAGHGPARVETADLDRAVDGAIVVLPAGRPGIGCDPTVMRPAPALVPEVPVVAP